MSNHTHDLILSHGIDVNGVEILQQSDDISDHYLVLCILHIAKAVNSTPYYKYGRTITSTTKDCFGSNLPDLSKFLSISNSSEKLDVTETMDSPFSSTLDLVAPLRLRKIKENSPKPWYNEHTRALKRADQKIEHSWKKTKLEVFHIAWQESTFSFRNTLKTARSDYFSSLFYQSLLSSFSAQVHTAKSSYFHNKINSAPDTPNLFKTFNSLLSTSTTFHHFYNS